MSEPEQTKQAIVTA